MYVLRIYELMCMDECMYMSSISISYKVECILREAVVAQHSLRGQLGADKHLEE